MSRAFVKEAEDKIENLPERAISQHRNLVTPEGLAAIEAARARFEQAHREAISNNDAYAAAAAMREIRYWRARRASAEVVRPAAEGSSRMGFVRSRTSFKARSECERRGTANRRSLRSDFFCSSG